MHTIYIDVPYEFVVDWIANASVDVSLSKQLDANIKFVCNNISGICDGDCYAVTFNDDKEALVWLIKNNFKLIGQDKVELYLSTKGHRLGTMIPINAFKI